MNDYERNNRLGAFLIAAIAAIIIAAFAIKSCGGFYAW